MTTDDLNFDDLVPKEIPVSVLRKKYVLRAASQRAAEAFRRASMRGVEMSTDDKDVRTTKNLQNLVEAESTLVANCLYAGDAIEYDGNDRIKNRLVGIETLRDWDAAITKRLFAKVKEISPALEETLADALGEAVKQRDRAARHVEALEKKLRDQQALLTPSTDGSESPTSSS